MRLYKALCAYYEALTNDLSQEREPVPQGDNFSNAERAHQAGQPELNSRDRPQFRKVGF